MIAKTPKAPYYTVIFTSTLTDDPTGYEKMAERMLALSQEQDGFLGIESAREDIGITVSYWKDMESIGKWRMNMEHQDAQEKGKSKWYGSFKVRIAHVMRDYGFGEE